jgi:acetyl-CoA carboxylase carboxyltransferase component
VDAYGGGAAVVTAQAIKNMNTAAWLNEQIA